MPKPDATGAGERLQTVGQLKGWLKSFPDHHKIVEAFPGEAGVNWIACRHPEGYVIIEVPRRLEQ